MIGGKAKYCWFFLAGLLSTVIWLYTTGRVYLYGFPQHVLEKLAQNEGLIPFEGLAPLYSILVRLPFDSVLAASLLQTSLTIGGFLVCWYALYKVWENPVSPTLTCTMLFFSSSTLWLAVESPETAMVTFLKALAVTLLVSGKVPLLAGVVLALGYSEPATGVAFYLALAWLTYLRRESYGPAVSTFSVVGTGTLLAVLVRSFTLKPSAQELSLWALVPILALALVKDLRLARTGFYLSLIGAALVTGTPEVASAICLGDLALLGLKTTSSEPEERIEPEGYSLSLGSLTQGLALLILIAAVLPGERLLNRTVLIPSQKKDVPLTQLFVPFSLATHGSQLGRPWRSSTPYPGLSEKGFGLLQNGKGPFRVLTPEIAQEDRLLSLSYALLTKRALRGWSTPRELSSSSLTCRALAKNVLLEDDEILFRHGGEERLETGPIAPKNLDEIPELDLKRVWSIPIRSQLISAKPGTGYVLKTLTTTEKLFFPENRATIIFSTAPEIYRVGSLTDPEQHRDFRINRMGLSLTATNLDTPFPSRSLVPLNFKLTNTGENPISTQELESITLGLKAGSDYPAPRQPFRHNFVLFPQESVDVTLFLPTPTQEGDFQLTALATSMGGQKISIPIAQPNIVHTWRRLAPVGTWVEEPATP